MDYLDPQKKRLKKNYLMLMYCLLGVAIAIATIVFVYLVNGYSIDRETGEVIQNGLIYVDTKPESAEIYLNGVKQRGRTDARLVIPEGTYDIELQRDGYRNWQRSLTLEGGSLRRLTYARLIPQNLDSEVALNLPFSPTAASQSIDKRWLVLADDKTPLVMSVIDLSRSELRLNNLQLPPDLLDKPQGGKWEILDWADDNRTFLASYTLKGNAEYVLIDHLRPENSRKLRTIFSSTTYTEIRLRNKKRDQVYLFNEKTGQVYRGNAGNGNTTPVLSDAVEFAAYGEDVFLYITGKAATDKTVRAVLQDGSDSYELRRLQKNSKYLLALSKRNNAFVCGVGSPIENRVIVYNDPIGALKKNDFSDLPVPTTVLKVKNPTELTISPDDGVIMTHGSQDFASHEFEADRSYTFSVPDLDESQKMRWYDGRHVAIGNREKQMIVDYDGSNAQELISSVRLLGTFMDRDANFLFSFSAAVRDSPPRLIKTYLRAQNDR